MSLDNFKTNIGEWLQGTGPDADLVISSRVRLARNLANSPFTSVSTEDQSKAVSERIETALQRLDGGLPLHVMELEKKDVVERQVLVERHLVSHDLATGSGSRLVAFDEAESFSVMGNEEDHLRLQVMKSGYQLEEAWSQMCPLERSLEEDLQFAFHSKYGYLTACPTNVGTGLRASVMLHLPAMVITGQIEEMTRAATKIHLAVRGLFGEGTEAQGDFFQMSNQRTLGLSEEQVLENIASVLPNIIVYERKLRDELLERRRERIEDRIGRAFGILSHARVITSKEALERLSLVRLGVAMGFLDDVSMNQINRMFLHSQPGHLQSLVGEPLTTEDRDRKRADLLRSILGDTSGEGFSSS
ncbi:MAG: protein arginine kinase [Planctomycetia bacterium]|nr:protein arginine kinase [Planctomycetia bacterium]